MSLMHDFFSKHGESMPDRDTVHIRDNFTKQEIYNLYRGFVEGAKGNGNFTNMHILQEYGKNSSTMSTFLRGQGWGFVVHVLLLKKEGINHKG